HFAARRCSEAFAADNDDREAHMIGNTVKISALLLATTLLCVPPVPQAKAQTKSPPKAPDVLFVQTAKNVTFKDGVLTLQDVAPATVFFSDRPERLVGHVRN